MADLGEEKKVSGVFGGVELNNIPNINIGVNEDSKDNANVNTNINETNNNTEGTEVAGVFGGINLEDNDNKNKVNAGTIENKDLPTKIGFWAKFKAFWLQEIDWNKEIKVELTPYQQKVEDEINEFLHQEITWKKLHNFLFSGFSFGKKNKENT